jgi:hypothetical protein
MLCGCPAATAASPPGSASLLSCSAISARRGPSANASPTRNLIRAGQRRLSRRRAALQQVEDVDGETLITINELQLRSLPLALSGLRLGVAFPLLPLWFFVNIFCTRVLVMLCLHPPD